MSKKKYKVGDLVGFDGGPVFGHAEKRYVEPGIILASTPSRGRQDIEVYKVRWHDGKYTTECACYLKDLSKNEQ